MDSLHTVEVSRADALRTFFRLFTPATWERAVAMLAEDARWEIFPRSVGRASTKAEQLVYLRDVMADFSEFKITPYDVVEGPGGVVWCAARSEAMHKIGGRYGQDYCFTFTFREDANLADGRGCIVHAKEFVDSLYAAKFFGRVEKKKAALAKSKL
eukprot:TRINITY_DN21092_c0_g1_i1.p3 TRINITY_DN21092_c0_g1~~TRINITY_DN21092_c0_g1_i1.p3  ORF type:complete len:156 (+),score=61.15 TRINITY_DN21092_c0_g1_i1:72-539(+)